MAKERKPDRACDLCGKPCWGKNCSDCVQKKTNHKLSRVYNRRNKNPYSHMN